MDVDYKIKFCPYCGVKEVAHLSVGSPFFMHYKDCDCEKSLFMKSIKQAAKIG